MGRPLGRRLIENGINTKDINRITEENIFDVLDAYDGQRRNLINDIVNNLEFSKKDKLKFIKHIGE